MKQLKLIQGKSPKEPKFTLKSVHPPRLTSTVAAGNSLGQVKSSPSNKSGKVSLNVGKTSSTNSRKKHPDVRIKKGDMAEFLKRKELRQVKAAEESPDEEVKSSESSGRLRDIGCQTIESNLAQKLAESAKLTMLYPKKDGDDIDSKMKASGDTGLHRGSPHSPRRTPEETIEMERNRSRLNSILERKDNKDPYLPSGKTSSLLLRYHQWRHNIIFWYKLNFFLHYRLPKRCVAKVFTRP